MSDAMLTTCVRCGEEATLTIAEALAWEQQHGPGKCPQLCGMSACAVGGVCQSRGPCEYGQAPKGSGAGNG